MSKIVIGYKDGYGRLGKIYLRIGSAHSGFVCGVISTLLSIYNFNSQNEFMFNINVENFQFMFERYEVDKDYPIIARKGFSGIETEYNLNNLRNYEFIVLSVGGKIYKGFGSLKVKVNIFRKRRGYKIMIEDIFENLEELKEKNIENKENEIN